VLIEKPARGDFLPIVDGGYSLQYSPLLEFREGLGLVLFCQLDVTGRSETDHAAQMLARNMFERVCSWKPTSRRNCVYAGDDAGFRHLKSAGFSPGRYHGKNLSLDEVLIVGPVRDSELAAHKAAIADWLKAGGNLLAIGLDEAGAKACLPFTVRMVRSEHISAFFDPLGADSLLAGIGPADVHSREPRELPLVTAGASVVGDGVLARAEGVNVVFCQLVPWQYDGSGKPNVKRAFRLVSFLVTRLLSNMGISSTTPILDRFATPVLGVASERRWLEGLYLDRPEEWDDPYRFFRW